MVTQSHKGGGPARDIKAPSIPAKARIEKRTENLQRIDALGALVVKVAVDADRGRRKVHGRVRVQLALCSRSKGIWRRAGACSVADRASKRTQGFISSRKGGGAGDTPSAIFSRRPTSISHRERAPGFLTFMPSLRRRRRRSAHGDRSKYQELASAPAPASLPTKLSAASPLSPLSSRATPACLFWLSATAPCAIAVASVALFLLWLSSASYEQRMLATLGTPLLFQPPSVTRGMYRYVHRSEVAAIVEAVEAGENFLVVEGGNRMGKSTVVEAALHILSRTRVVRSFSRCFRDSTAGEVLQSLLGLERDKPLDNLLRFFVPSDAEQVVSFKHASGMALKCDRTKPEPVFVIEQAERLSAVVLKDLFDFAKELIDYRLGRFIFVFSPATTEADLDKQTISIITSFGSFTRAQVVPVLDFSRDEALVYLSKASCNETRAELVYRLVGGHLYHLQVGAVNKFCSGVLNDTELEETFSQSAGALFSSIDKRLECRPAAECACRALCAVIRKEWDHELLASPRKGIPAMLAMHLIRGSLKHRIYVLDAPFNRAYTERRCGCKQD